MMKRCMLILLLIIAAGIISGCAVRRTSVKETGTELENITETGKYKQTEKKIVSDTTRTENVTIVYVIDTIKNTWVPVQKSESKQTSIGRQQSIGNISATDTITTDKYTTTTVSTETTERKNTTVKWFFIGFALGIVLTLGIILLIKK